jgi:hypothetical protein
MCSGYELALKLARLSVEAVASDASFIRNFCRQEPEEQRDQGYGDGAANPPQAVYAETTKSDYTEKSEKIT